MITDKERAAEVRRLVGIFSQGCSNTLYNAGLKGKEPEECEQCLGEFMRQVRWAVGDAGIEYNRVTAAAFGNKVRPTPSLPTLTRSGRARLRWWASQLAAMAAALKAEAAEHNEAGRKNAGLLLIRLQLSVEETGEWAEAVASGDIARAFQELVDMSVVTDGHYHTLGLADVKLAGYAEVHAANMSKLGEDGRPIISPAGRWMKGPNTRKPDMLRVLNEARDA